MKCSKNIAISFLFLGCALSCGQSQNAFELLVDKDEKDRGRTAYASGDYDAAITELETYVAENPDDPEARSLLASSYMKKSGFDEIEVLTNLSQADGSSGDVENLMSSLPEGNTENIQSMEKAVENLEAIPVSQRSPEQNQSLAVAQVAVAVTKTKSQVGDDSGNVDPTKVSALSDAEANSIVENINGAATNLESAEQSTGEDSEASSKLKQLSQDIAAESGSTNAEKFKNFLSKQ